MPDVGRAHLLIPLGTQVVTRDKVRANGHLILPGAVGVIVLYLYRVLLTGIHLMRTGVVEANLISLNEQYRLPQIPALLERKVLGTEQTRLEEVDVALHQREYERLAGELEAASQVSHLLGAPTARAALNDLLLRLRLAPASHPSAGVTQP